jgi:hypothetical protein
VAHHVTANPMIYCDPLFEDRFAQRNGLFMSNLRQFIVIRLAKLRLTVSNKYDLGHSYSPT